MNNCSTREMSLHSVIMVCTGNLCRSPMAEGILKRKVALMNRNDIKVSSMGIHARENQNATSNAIEVCRENLIDITGHQSRPLVFEELRAADIVFVMEKFHNNFIRTFVPQAAEKVALLAGWPSMDSKEHSVPDPINGKINEYRKTFKLIEFHIDRVMPFLLAEIAPAK
jgi:protein-tyrosine phosphatase